MDSEDNRQLQWQLHLEVESLAHVGSFIWDLRTQALTWSDELFRIFGYSPHSITPTFELFLSHLHPEDRGHVASNIRNVSEMGGLFEHKERIIRADGELRSLHTRGKMTFDSEGNPSKLIGTCADITTQTEFFQRLNASESRYRMLVEHASDAMFMYRDGGMIIDVNSRACEMLGYDRSELIHHFPTKFVVGMTKDRMEAISRMLDHQEEACWESIHQHKNGKRIPVEVRMRRFREQGEKRSVAIIRDISERRNAEKAARASDRRMRLLLENAKMLVWEADPSHFRYKYISDHCESFLGYSKEEWLSADFWQRHLYPDDLLEATEIRQRCTRTGKGGRLEYRMIAADGKTVWLEEVIHVYLDEVDLYLGGVLIDISERRVLNDQLLQAQKMEAVGRLAGGIAHDFNNILTVIIGYSELLLMSMNEDAPNRSSIVAIHDAGEKASFLTRQLLAYSRRAVVEPQLFDLNALIRESETLFRPILGESVELQILADPNLHPIKADRVQIEQVLMNLIINARDAMKSGGVLTIETQNHLSQTRSNFTDHPEYEVILTVADTGSGMSEEILSKIFDPFFTTKEVGRGTGLGLSVVQGVIANAGGFIHVDSAVGVGTQFHIHLPASHGPLSEPTSMKPKRTSGCETVLLVEDDPNVRRITHAALVDQGYCVIQAQDGYEALTCFEQSSDSIDLLLTDVVMPGMSGRQLAEYLRAKKPTLPVLFMSGHTEDAVLQHGVQRSFDSIIQKPFSPYLLGLKLRKIFSIKDRSTIEQ